MGWSFAACTCYKIISNRRAQNVNFHTKTDTVANSVEPDETRTKTDTFANSVGPDEMAHNEPSHLDQHCLSFSVSVVIETLFCNNGHTQIKDRKHQQYQIRIHPIQIMDVSRSKMEESIQKN